MAELLAGSTDSNSDYVSENDSDKTREFSCTELEVLPCHVDSMENKFKSICHADRHRRRHRRPILHYAQSVKIARFLIDKHEDKSAYVNLTNSNGQTPLHCAKTVEIAHLLINTVKDKPAYVNLRDSNGRTALHRAETVEISRLLINTAEDKSAYVNLTDNDGETALHYAETVQMAHLLIETAEDKSAYVNLTDIYGQTALHCAKTVEIARLIIEAADDKSAYVNLAGSIHQTALHCAKTVEIACLLIEKAENKSAYVNLTNSNRQTSLHYAQTVEIAHLLIDTADDKSAYVNLTDRFGQTALHCAKTVKMACLLIDTAEDKSAYVNIPDSDGQTALHHANSVEIALLLIDTADDKLTYINMTDNEGNTALMSMVAQVDAFQSEKLLQYTLEKLIYELQPGDMKKVLLTKNNNQQTIFHLACISPYAEQLYEVLRDYLEDIDLKDIITPDKLNNTPFTYLAARLSTSILAELILKYPLYERRDLLSKPNKKQTSCLSLASLPRYDSVTYMEIVLCSEGVNYNERFHKYLYFGTEQMSPLKHSHRFKIDIVQKNITWKVIEYALNEYSLRDLQISSLQPSLPLLYFDGKKITLRAIQRKLDELDNPAYHSRPKLIVIVHQMVDQIQYASPPGPDFLIISVVPLHSGSDIYSDLLKETFVGIRPLLGFLKNHELTKYVNINSTMGKHFGTSIYNPTDDEILLTGEKALIICNTERREGWEIDCNKAHEILKKQLGLKVECLFDKSADKMLREIKDFSQQPGHGSVVALVIMSHGDMKGNITGNADGTHCSVQEVVDALCQPELKSCTKMVFLTFCRGSIGSRGTRCNRTNHGWETTTLKDLAMLPEFNPIPRGVFEDHLKKVRAEHPFPSVDVPVNCYLCYSTLPDSWSFRYNRKTKATNLMWQCLGELLSNLYPRKTNIQATSTTTASVLRTNTVNASQDILEESELSSRHSAAVQTQSITTVELTSLLIDLSGVIREKSEFTQYLNFCYALDKDSKPVALQVFPADL